MHTSVVRTVSCTATRSLCARINLYTWAHRTPENSGRAGSRRGAQSVALTFAVVRDAVGARVVGVGEHKDTVGVGCKHSVHVEDPEVTSWCVSSWLSAAGLLPAPGVRGCSAQSRIEQLRVVVVVWVQVTEAAQAVGARVVGGGENKEAQQHPEMV